MRLFCIAYILSSCLEVVLAGRVLIVLPLPMYSHTMPFMPLFKALADKGHQVTFVSPFAQKLSVRNFRNIDVPFSMDKLRGALGNTSKADIRGLWYEFFGTSRSCINIVDAFLPEFKDALPSPTEKFDLIIIEAFFCQQPLIALGQYYGAPIVVTHPGPMTPTVSYHTGNPTLPSYVPVIRAPFTDHMDFWCRLKNVAITASELLLNKYYALPNFDRSMREWMPIPNLPYIEDMLTNVSLVLIDTHFTLNYGRPYDRNVLEVGGMSVYVAEPLPADLERFISEAQHGVIYFSLGSNIDGKNLRNFLLNVMESFKYVKQRVLFKIDGLKFPNVPENVEVRPWFPQPSILSHKNVVLFISHGGLNSIHEAAYHGVPILGVPFYVDQPHNVLLMKQLGVGLYLDPDSVEDPTVMVAALKEVLENASYREAAKKRSEIIKDLPIPVLDESIFWVEYVMRHGGARHLRPASLDLEWYQLMLLDVVGLTAGILLILAVIFCCIVKRSCRKMQKIPTVTSRKMKKQ